MLPSAMQGTRLPQIHVLAFATVTVVGNRRTKGKQHLNSNRGNVILVLRSSRDDHAAYIASWMTVLHGDKRAIFTLHPTPSELLLDRSTRGEAYLSKMTHHIDTLKVRRTFGS